jgi:hypothetical protein
VEGALSRARAANSSPPPAPTGAAQAHSASRRKRRNSSGPHCREGRRTRRTQDGVSAQSLSQNAKLCAHTPSGKLACPPRKTASWPSPLAPLGQATVLRGRHDSANRDTTTRQTASPERARNWQTGALDLVSRTSARNCAELGLLTAPPPSQPRPCTTQFRPEVRRARPPRPTILRTKSAPPAPATVLASCEPGPPQGVELDDYHDRLVAPKLRAGGRQTPTFRPRPQRRSGSVPKARRLPPVFLGKLVRPSSEPAAEFHNRIAGPTQR